MHFVLQGSTLNVRNQPFDLVHFASMAPLRLQNSSNSWWHRFNEGLETFLTDHNPYWHDSITRLTQICQLHIHDANHPFHHFPHSTELRSGDPISDEWKKTDGWMDWRMDLVTVETLSTVNSLSGLRSHFEMIQAQWHDTLREAAVRRWSAVVVKALTWSATVLSRYYGAQSALRKYSPHHYTTTNSLNCWRWCQILILPSKCHSRLVTHQTSNVICYCPILVGRYKCSLSFLFLAPGVVFCRVQRWSSAYPHCNECLFETFIHFL